MALRADIDSIETALELCLEEHEMPAEVHDALGAALSNVEEAISFLNLYSSKKEKN